jgi:hypothetical protein
MIKPYNKSECKGIRLYILYNLIFFVFILLSCRNKTSSEITILWNDEQATGISIPKNLLDDTSGDSINQVLKVELAKDSNATAILGDYRSNGNEVIFQPLIPFSRGLRYTVLFKNKRVGEVEIPSADPAAAPILRTLYPTQDTLPENLLKIYLQFSQPMREGESQKYIALIKNEHDTLSGIFLNLQPELWNEDRTVLTIWLDPGRIKRDLIPNRRLGNPLKKGDEYKLVVSDQWKDIQGLPLKQPYIRKVFITARDGLSPDPNKWLIKVPAAGSVAPFEADLREPLDFFLLKESLTIIDEKGNAVRGTVKITDEEKRYQFIPSGKWTDGNYTLQIQTRLEDLAGNNINRVFDRDITDKKVPASNVIFTRRFKIK